MTGKFLTLTGKAIHSTDVNERSKELQMVLDTYMKRPDADIANPIVDAPGSFLSDASVYAMASRSKQADKFKALWNGEILQGKSHSEADIALAEILAFWCGGDTEQKELEQRQMELQEFIDKSKKHVLNVDSFLKVARKYTNITELTAEIIRSFVERIDVYKPEKILGTRTKKQTICIHWNFVGAVDTPTEHEKMA